MKFLTRALRCMLAVINLFWWKTVSWVIKLEMVIDSAFTVNTNGYKFNKSFTSDKVHVTCKRRRGEKKIIFIFTFLFFSSPVQLVCCIVSWMSIGEEMSRCWGKKGLTPQRLESYSGKTSHQGWKVVEAFFARSESHQLWGQLLRWGRPLGAKNHWWRKTLHHTTWKAQWIFLYKSVSKHKQKSRLFLNWLITVFAPLTTALV